MFDQLKQQMRHNLNTTIGRRLDVVLWTETSDALEGNLIASLRGYGSLDDALFGRLMSASKSPRIAPTVAR